MMYSDKNHSKGFSIVEALIGAGVLIVIAAFAVPSYSTSAAKAELQSAVENTQRLITTGRNTARILGTPIVMHLNGDHKLKQHSITFTFPDRNDTLYSDASIQDYELPQGVWIVSEETEVRFDTSGMVESPIQVSLVSTADESVSERVLIQ